MKGSSYCTLCNKTVMGETTYLERQSNMQKQKKAEYKKKKHVNLKYQ